MKLQNRHDASWAPELLYYRSEIIGCAIQKHGSDYKRSIQMKRERRAERSAQKKKAASAAEEKSLVVFVPLTPSKEISKKLRWHK
jgi:hypothetical protein